MCSNYSIRGSGGLDIVAMRQLPRGFCNPYKMSQKEAFEIFLEIFVWNAAEAFD
jgi:hypothetical protein